MPKPSDKLRQMTEADTSPTPKKRRVVKTPAVETAVSEITTSSVPASDGDLSVRILALVEERLKGECDKIEEVRRALTQEHLHLVDHVGELPDAETVTANSHAIRRLEEQVEALTQEQIRLHKMLRLNNTDPEKESLSFSDRAVVGVSSVAAYHLTAFIWNRFVTPGTGVRMPTGVRATLTAAAVGVTVVESTK